MSIKAVENKLEGKVANTKEQVQSAEAALPMNKLGAEAFGTFLLVFGGLGVGLLAGVQETTIIPVALAFGLSLMAGIFAVGHISGGHFNPAVTIAQTLAKRFEAKNVLPYIAAQLIGAAAATGLLYLITLDTPLITSDVRSQLFTSLANSYGDDTKLKFGAMAAILTEAAVTAIFISIILAVTSKKAPKSVQNAAPFAIGLTLAVMIQVALPITNAALNPARATATALTAPSSFGHLWAFWVGPILGGVIAGLLFNMIDNGGKTAKTTTDTTSTKTQAKATTVADATTKLDDSAD
ncbi:MAG: aquaporin, partial [Micrococcaceae bacterium]